MKLTKILGPFVLLLLLMTGMLSAQEDATRAYLGQTTSMYKQMQDQVGVFLAELEPLREAKDIVAMKRTADKFVGVWGGFSDRLNQITPPADAQAHYQALGQMFDLQRQSSQLMSDTLTNYISLILERQKMQKAGASQQDIDSFVANNTPDKAELTRKTVTIKSDIRTADATVKSENKRMVAALTSN